MSCYAFHAVSADNLITYFGYTPPAGGKHVLNEELDLKYGRWSKLHLYDPTPENALKACMYHANLDIDDDFYPYQTNQKMETLVQQHPVIFAYQAHQTPRGHSHILIPCEENKGMNAPRFHFHTQLVSFKTAQNIALHKLMCVKENMVSTSTLDQARLRQAEYMLKHVEANENGRFAAITGKHPNIAEAVILFREGVDFLIDHIDDEWQIQPGIYL